MAVLQGNIGVDGVVILDKQGDVWCNPTRVLVDRHMLILHLVDQQRSLEQLFLVPADLATGIDPVSLSIGALAQVNLPGMGCHMAGICQLLLANRFNQVVDLPVVVLMPDMVDGG